MSERNVDLIRRGLELFNQGEFDAVLDEVIHPEIEMTPGIGPLLGVGTIRGRDAVRRFWVEELPQGLGGFRVDPLEFVDFGEVVLVEARYRARGPGSGMDVEQPFTTLYSFRDGLVQRIHDYASRDEAVEAAGLQE
jgi:ketosteroid isomerase-like protein